MRSHDPAQQQIAARLAVAHHPRWVIWWGTGSRCYWAIPCWIPSATIILGSPDEADLQKRMRLVEARYPP
ncbi:MAG TPA: hypothetical protein VGL93_01535 [Streptosporangiaceae bacterium]|jgi:hypothetical protein